MVRRPVAGPAGDTLVRKDQDKLAIEPFQEAAERRSRSCIDDQSFTAGLLEHRPVPRGWERRVERHIAVTPREHAEDGGERSGASVGEHACERRPVLVGVL